MTGTAQLSLRAFDVPVDAPVRLALIFGEVLDSASVPRDGARHRVSGGQGALVVPGTVRLRADAPGYVPLTRSPILDAPSLVDAMTRLDDNDLLKWETFENVRALLANLELTFKLKGLP